MRIDRFKTNYWISIFILLLLLLVGCVTENTASLTPLPQPTLTASIEPVLPTEESNQQVNELITLKIWVPPEFDPTNGSSSAELLAARFEEFEKRKGNVRIETRVKTVEGSGGIIDVLTTANAAARLALPDLVALPQHALNTAAIKGLLYPFDGLTETMKDPDWYDFAAQISNVQDNTFGIPFAGDALIFVYRPTILPEQPHDWASLLTLSTQTSTSLSFPASDPDSLLTLTYYQSLGGSLMDEENRPRLDSVQLTEVLTYYHSAEQSMLMPFWLTQYETDEQAWIAYEENQTDMVITWASRYLNTLPADSTIAPIPTKDGTLFTLGTGWVWALACPDIERQTLSAQLAEFIADGDFLSAWTEAGGYIPTRSSSISSWDDTNLRFLIGEVASSIRLVPHMDILTTIGPILQNATIDVLKEEASPINAVETAIDALETP